MTTLFALSTPAAESHDALLLAPSTRCMRLCLDLLMAAIASALAGPPSKVKLVAFDLDGTLIDSVPDLAAAIDATLEEQGQQPVGAEKVRDWVGNGSYKLSSNALRGLFYRLEYSTDMKNFTSVGNYDRAKETTYESTITPQVEQRLFIRITQSSE